MRFYVNTELIILTSRRLKASAGGLGGAALTLQFTFENSNMLGTKSSKYFEMLFEFIYYIKHESLYFCNNSNFKCFFCYNTCETRIKK